MAEQKESSVLFSLKELMNLEEDRIKQEEDQKRQAEEEVARARAEAERKVREEEEARIRAAEDKRRAEEQRTREEAAKLDAIRQGEVEKARLEAENRARMEQMRNQQEHERQLAMVTQDKSKKRLVMIASGIGVLFLAGIVGGAVLFSNSQKQKQQLEAQLTDLQAKQEENQRKMNELNDKLSHTTSPEERAALEAQIAEAQKKATDLANAKSHIGGTGMRNPTAAAGAAPAHLPKCKCQQGDPTCFELPGQNCTP